MSLGDMRSGPDEANIQGSARSIIPVCFGPREFLFETPWRQVGLKRLAKRF